MLVATAASAIAAVLAWGSKLYWSKEYRSAKDEIAKSKDSEVLLLKEKIEHQKELMELERKQLISQLEHYKSLTPDIITQHHKATVQELEKIAVKLKERIADLEKELKDKEKQIEELEVSKTKSNYEFSSLQKERDELKEILKNLSGYLKGIIDTMNYHSRMVIHPNLLISATYQEAYENISTSLRDNSYSELLKALQNSPLSILNPKQRGFEIGIIKPEYDFSLIEKVLSDRKKARIWPDEKENFTIKIPATALSRDTL